MVWSYAAAWGTGWIAGGAAAAWGSKTMPVTPMSLRRARSAGSAEPDPALLGAEHEGEPDRRGEGHRGAGAVGGAEHPEGVSAAGVPDRHE